MSEKKPASSQEITDEELAGANGGVLRAAARTRCGATTLTAEDSGHPFPPIVPAAADVAAVEVTSSALVSN